MILADEISRNLSLPQGNHWIKTIQALTDFIATLYKVLNRVCTRQSKHYKAKREAEINGKDHIWSQVKYAVLGR